MEKRKDYVLDEWTIIAEHRKRRPHDYKPSEQKIPEKSVFSPGSEHLTPPEIGRVEDKNGWLIRWFPNKFPILQPARNFEKDHECASEIFGYSEIIVEHPEVSMKFSDYSIDHTVKILKVYKQRVEDLSSKDGIKYVTFFRNEGKEAGASLVHPHSQVIAVNEIPPRVKQKMNKCKSNDMYGKIMPLEKKTKRKIMEDKNFFVLAPYASRFPYTALILPKKLIRSLDDFTEDMYKSFAKILKKLTGQLDKYKIPYNIMYYYNVDKKNKMRFHASIRSRIQVHAGFEFETNYSVNVVSPETAAEFYRS